MLRNYEIGNRNNGIIILGDFNMKKIVQIELKAFNENIQNLLKLLKIPFKTCTDYERNESTTYIEKYKEKYIRILKRYDIPYRIAYFMSFKAKPEFTVEEKTCNRKEGLISA